MKRHRLILFATLCLPLVQPAFAQTSTETTSGLPRLVRFAGTVKGPDGSPLAGAAGITFALYSEQTGGAPLWMETQNVAADNNGRYSVLLGATKSGGLPAELFTSEQAHWVGVQAEGQPEQPRVLLVSAPYALKAGDAETIGGLPPTAFVLAAPPANGPPAAGGTATSTAASDAGPATTMDVTTTGGSSGYLPYFTGSATVLDSLVSQSGTGSTAKISIKGALSLPATGTATASAGDNSEPLNLVASAFDSSSSAAVAHTFQLRAEPASNDTAAASGALSLLYGAGANTPAETGLKIASNGQITFAAGQTFPGTGDGTVTSVGSGAGLTGGPITASGTLSVAAGGVSNAMLANPSLTVTAGTDLAGGGAVALGGSTTISLNTSLVPQLAASNIFSGAQTINGILLFPATNSSGTQGVISIGGGPFLHNYGPSGTPNVFVGGAGNFSTTGGLNTAIGSAALSFNTTGQQNAAGGAGALNLNTSGGYNTAFGASALYSDSTGSSNTALGNQALYYTTGTNNIGIGVEGGASITNTSNNIDIGHYGVAGDSGIIRIGLPGAQTSTYIAGIYGATTSLSGAVPVMIDASGNLGTISSSRRYKEDIQDMADASSGLLRLRPVTFRYKKPYADGSQPIQYGLIAEEVAEVYPDLVARSADGQIETVKYQVLGPMLLNELQKQNATIAAQKEQIGAQQEQIRSLEQRLTKLEAALAAHARPKEQ